MNSELKKLLALYNLEFFMSFLKCKSINYDYFYLKGSITVFGNAADDINDKFFTATINGAKYAIAESIIKQLTIDYKRFIELRMFV